METKQDLKNKVVLLTGAARRIGAEISSYLHRAGMRILVHCNHSQKEAEILVKKLNSACSDSAHLLVADLLCEAAIKQLARQAIERWGKVDVLINNASAFQPSTIGNLNKDLIHKMLDIHITAPLLLIQELASELRHRRGCIVNMTDIHFDRPLKNYVAYSIAKAGLVALNKSVARELAPEVRCNAIAPGAILWPEAQHYEQIHQEIIERTALKCEGSPTDIAKAVLYLIADAEYITGQTIVIDGGRTLSH